MSGSSRHLGKVPFGLELFSHFHQHYQLVNWSVVDVQTILSSSVLVHVLCCFFDLNLPNKTIITWVGFGDSRQRPLIS